MKSSKTMVEKLKLEDREREIETLDHDWEIINSKLVLSLKLNNFVECVDLVTKIAKIAEGMNHHPDVKIYDYKNLEISVTTHELGGLSEKDFILAREIEKLIP